MRIHSIAATPTFGYNKELNDKVNKELAKSKNQGYDKTLLAMNKLCMETENKLRKAEKERRRNLVEKYATLFLTAKTLTADQIEERFPKLNYLNTEMNTYVSEVKERSLQNKPHWLNELVDNLMEVLVMQALPDGTMIVAEDHNTGEITPINEAIKKEEAQEEKQNKTATELAMEHHLELYTPKEFSPKGFSSLGGMEDVKALLSDNIILPLIKPEDAYLDLIEYGKNAPRGELLYGPPGCGKTAIVEALSSESELPLYKVKIANTGSKYINESAINLQDAYSYVKEVAADTYKPALMLIDEIETLAPKRSEGNGHSEDNKIVGTLLQILEEARGNNVIILCTTNYYDMLDDAIKSRLEDKIYIGLPDDETRRKVLEVLLNRITKGQTLANSPEELDKVVKLTEGFSNRDLTILTDKAARIARADNRREITAADYINPVAENQNMKVKEDKYRDKSSTRRIGF